jgi:hypothetical protein
MVQNVHVSHHQDVTTEGYVGPRIEISPWNTKCFSVALGADTMMNL